MEILVTNDDGFQSPPLLVLCSLLSKKHTVKVVAPANEQSGIGQAISLNQSLTYKGIDWYEYPVYLVSGTPSDCVKLAVCHLFEDQKFDLVLSGPNTCENAGLSTLYSGTVAGAREGATWGIPSIALSVWDDEIEKIEYAAGWMAGLLEKPGLLDFPPGVFWSINFPDSRPQEIAGVKIAHMSTAMFKDHYQEYTTPRGVPEYWLTGAKRREQFEEGSDDLFLLRKNITITPLHLNQTCVQEKDRLFPLLNEFMALQESKQGTP
ncbi:5'/3'-nucleotidase SurE [Fibrobacterota bacterium]